MENTHRSLTPQNLLSAAVKNVFDNWEAFKIGTSMGKDANEKAKWIIQVTEKCLYENTDVEDGAELGEWIGDILDAEFNLIVEDGSIDVVGNQLITYWKMFQNQKFLELADILDKKVAEAPAVSLPPRFDPGSSSSDDSDGDEEMDAESSPQPGSSNQPTVSEERIDDSGPDPDGWITVKKTKKR